MGLAADHDFPPEVIRQKRLERLEKNLPRLLPAPFEALSRVLLFRQELGVAMAVWLLAVALEKVDPARPHVAREVLDDQGDAVGLGVERREEVRVGNLRQGLLGELLQAPQLRDRLRKELRFHVSSWILPDRLKDPGRTIRKETSDEEDDDGPFGRAGGHCPGGIARIGR